jgi:Rrf2 family cysteine metabolism transcriptional repressor
MKLSTRARYGVLFMLDLAIHCGEDPIPLKDIAERQQVPEKYLSNLLVPLKTAGLVRSVTGAHGGFTLARSPEKVNLRDIVSILEGSLCLVDCVDNPAICQRAETCIIRRIWTRTSSCVRETLNSITLRDMVEEYQEEGVKVPHAAGSGI